MVACEIPGLLLAMMLVDRSSFGRIKTLKIFSFIACISAFITGFVELNGIKILFSCFIYVFLIPIWGLLYLYSSEIFGTKLRSTAMGYFFVIGSAPGLFVPYLDSYIINDHRSWVYMSVWASLIFANFCFSFLLKKETSQTNLIN